MAFEWCRIISKKINRLLYLVIMCKCFYGLDIIRVHQQNVHQPVNMFPQYGNDILDKTENEKHKIK